MKNTIKLLGIIVIIAIIGFSITGCFSTGGGFSPFGGMTAEEQAQMAAAAEQSGQTVVNDAPSGSGGSNFSSLPVITWPADSVWGQRGLSGLRQPSGTRVVGEINTGALGVITSFYIVLLDADKAAYDNIRGQITAMGFTLMSPENTTAEGQAVGLVKQSTMNVVAVRYIINENAVAIMPQQ